MSIIPLTFKEGANSGGPPDLRGRFHWRRLKGIGSKARVTSLPRPPKPREKPAGLKRRASSLLQRCGHGTEAPRPP